MKKVIIAILFILVIGAGVTGTLIFYNKNKNQIAANEQLAMQNAQVQAQLNAIGQMVEVYGLNKKVYSGNTILDGDLIAISVPASTLADSSITDKSLLVGQCYKIDLQPGTILSTDMIMEQNTDTPNKFPYELTLESIPVGTTVGDYVDVRFLIPSGEEFVVVNHKKVMRIYETTITINVTEEESAVLLSMMHDLATYEGMSIAYVTKYLEPGNSDTISLYPVQHDMENYVRFNPNISDPTRCINETFRDHIDEIFLIYTDSENEGIAKGFIANVKTQLSGQLSAHESWIEEHTDENGNVVSDNGTVTEGQSFQQQVNESIESIEDNLEDLEGIY